MVKKTVLWDKCDKRHTQPRRAGLRGFIAFRPLQFQSYKNKAVCLRFTLFMSVSCQSVCLKGRSWPENL